MFLQQLITGLSVGSIYALMAVGYSLIYSGAKYDWSAICFPVVFCAAGCYRLRKFLYGEGA